LSPRTVLQKSVPGGQLKERPQDSAVVSVVKRVLRPGASDKIKVRGTDDIMVFRAKCCNPIRGEKIVGYITRGKGVSVHSATCSNVLNLMFDPERRIDVEWDTTTSDQAPYTVRLTMQVRIVRACSPKSARSPTSTPTSRTWRPAPATISRRAST
jgi:GTP pyrophosphokinase